MNVITHATARSRIWTLVPVVLLIAATIGCDRVTKQIALTTLSHLPRQSFLADTVRLEYAENPGAFLGLGAHWPPAVRTGLFTVGNGLVLLTLAVLAIRRRWPPLMAVGLALFFAGGASNLVDRAIRGNVIDFMNVGVGPLRTGIFNVADAAIIAGAALMIVAGYRLRENLERSEADAIE